MPRTDTNRGVVLTYRPGNPTGPGASPEEQSRAIWEELMRIAISLSQVDEPVSVGAQVSGTLPVANTQVWSRIFDGGYDREIWSMPSNTFDVNNGFYVVPQEGVYSFQAQLSTPAFDAPGNKYYYIGLRGTVVPADGSPTDSRASFNGGFDTVACSVSILATIPLQKGSQVWIDATCVHENNSGTVPYEATLQVQRLSGLGNNTQ